MPEPSIVLDSATKEYRVTGGRRLFLGMAMARLRGHRPQVRAALDNVSFKVSPGTTLGVIGANGSGKSTLLRLISGVTAPTSGRVETRGRLVSLLELGAGFDERLTARDNIYLNGALIGIPREVITKQLESILDFAGLSDFASAPLATFSSGMIVRLGFAIAVHAEADVLLFDEVLAVGDLPFQAKCLDAIGRLRRDGKTIVFVSHDLYSVRNVSDEVLMLHHGHLEAVGRPADVIQRYWSTVLGEDSIASIKSGPLNVVFQGGQLALWFAERAITKGFSGYTSVRSFVAWHESDKARWKIISRSDSRIEATGRYWGLPGEQRWIVEVGSDGTLSWEVTMSVDEELRLEREQANFMLCEQYDRVRCDGYEAEMGEFKRAVGDDWEEVCSIDGERGAVELLPSDPALPSVRFACSPSARTHMIRAVNSDANFRGRLVQALRKSGTELKSPGKYDFFRGTLQIRRAS